MCALLVTLSSAGRVHADELEEARAQAHFLAGESHFAGERWDEAAREFLLAYDFSKKPELLVNAARAHERGEQYAEALRDLERLLAQHPDTPHRGEAELRMEKLRVQIEQQARREERAATPKREQAEAARPAEASTHAQAEPSVWPPRWSVFALAGGALAVGVASLATGLRAHELHGRLEDQCPKDLCAPGYERDQRRGRRLASSSTALTFVSLALLGGAAGLWIYDVRKAPERSEVALSVDRASFGAEVRTWF